jgi:hypothetical protein
MNKELYSLLKSNTSRELTDSFIDNAINIMVSNEKELTDYIRNVRIESNKKETETCAYYSPFDKVIFLHPDNIVACKLSNDFLPIQFLHILRHEIEHARNLKKLHEGRNDIESIVISYGSINYILSTGLKPEIVSVMNSEKRDFIIGLNHRMKRNYDYNPDERIAEINASKFIVNLLKNQRNSKDLILARVLLESAYIQGYEKTKYTIEPPTYTYLQNMEMFRFYMDLKHDVNNTNYSLETRLLCGLPIRDSELEIIYNKTMKIKK